MPIIKILVLALLFVALLAFIFGLVASSKLMAVEMIYVVQLSYIGLIMIDKLEALIYPLINLWPINGYNNLLADGDGLTTPSRVTSPGYKAFFLANFSIDIIIVLAPLIVGGILYFRARRVEEEEERIRKISQSSRVMK